MMNISLREVWPWSKGTVMLLSDFVFFTFRPSDLITTLTYVLMDKYRFSNFSLVLFILLELDYRIFALALDPLHSEQNQSESYVKK